MSFHFRLPWHREPTPSIESVARLRDAYIEAGTAAVLWEDIARNPPRKPTARIRKGTAAYRVYLARKAVVEAELRGRT